MALLLTACGQSDAQVVSSPPATQSMELNRAVLESLGMFPGTSLVREYVDADGSLVREYASEQEPQQAATAITVFFREQLKAMGWETLQEHAAVSAYYKGEQVLQILRSGQQQTLPTREQQTLKTAPAPSDARFFFALASGPKS
jgi:hypothetical protein